MQDFKKLDVWKNALDFSKEIYKISFSFPKEEQFGITAQLRRASASIGANIAEGCGKMTKKDFIRFLHNSLGSARECEYFLILSKELGFIDESSFVSINNNLNNVTGKLINFIKFLKNS